MELLNLSGQDFAILAVIVTCAGIVRGFSGFALSALVMAVGVMILPPIELIPICLVLEIVASSLMARGGWRDADRSVVAGLVVGSVMGVPVGVMIMKSLDVETSKRVVLTVIVSLAALQLAKVRLAFLATKLGLYISGFTAGIVTGLAQVGGMVVALYVLSQNVPAAKMRASLILFLLIGSMTTTVTYTVTGVLTGEALARGGTLAIFAGVGVFAGQQLFTERLTRYYRPFCLSLLISLAGMSLVRTVTT
jgi:uncharacterized membrane protein YfcA